MKLEERITDNLNNKIYADVLSFPKKNLLIELTNNCNNKCIFCYNDCMKRTRKFISRDLCEKVLKDSYVLGMREVGFYLVGEPLLDKRLEYFVLFAKKIGYNYIYITTNGILADIDRVKKLYECGLNSIKYSINATNKEDYKFIHGTDNFDKVILNLKNVYEWKNNNKIDLNVYVSYITTNYTNNKQDISVVFSDICDEYVIMPAINQGGLISNINDISIKNEGDINGNFKLPCPYPFNSVIITAEGFLTACCMDFENFLAYGDLNKNSLIEIWNNDIIKKFRKMHINGSVNNTICHNCIFGGMEVPVPLNEQLCNLKNKDKDAIFKKLSLYRREDNGGY